MKKLTKVGIERLTPPRQRPRIVWDATTTGLGIKVTRTGKKVFVLQLVYPGARVQSRRKLGLFPGMSLEEARAKAAKWHGLVKRGLDPADVEAKERREAEAKQRAEALKDASTFAAFAERLISERTNRRAKTDAREIRRNLITKWGGRPLHSITPRDVRELISALKVRAPYEARNTWTHCVGIFKAAVHEELIEASPTASLDKRLLFKGAKIEPRQRVLNDDEVCALWRAAGRIGYPYGPFYRLLLLSGLRVNELAKTGWSELHPDLRRTIREAKREDRNVDWSLVDDRIKLLTIPRERFKSDAEHVVPVPNKALSIIEDLPHFARCDSLFTFNGQVPINSFSTGKRLLDARMLQTLKALARQRGDDPEAVMLSQWVSHDLRRVVRTNLAALDVPDHIAEICLGHGRKGLQRVYDQHRYEPQIREALERWADRLSQIVGQRAPEPTPSNVVKLREAAL